MAGGPDDESWPALPYAAWRDTCATLHLWTQIVGKVRLALTPWLNHSWHVPLYVTRARPDHLADPPRRRARSRSSSISSTHVLRDRDSDGGRRASSRCEPQPVAEFYAAVMAALARARHRR